MKLMDSLFLSNRTIVAYLLKFIRLDYTSLYLHEVCKLNPNMEQTILGISKILALYRVEQNAVWVVDKKDFIHSYDSLFIAQLSDRSICIVKKESDKISTFDGKSNINYDLEQFVEEWTGVALLVEKTEESKEPDYKQNLIKYRLHLLIEIGCAFSLLFLLITLAVSTIGGDVQIFISLLINLLGVAVCCLLLSKQLNSSHSLAQKVCTAFSKQDGCSAVLNTKAAKVAGVFSWSEIGFGFFLTNCIWILIAPIFYPYVLLINCLSLLFSIWSIGYQFFIAKQWCVLCLCSQIVLWGFCLLNINRVLLPFTLYEWDRFCVVGALFLFNILAANRIVAFITKNKSMQSAYTGLNQLRMDPNLFNFLLAQQSFYVIDKSTSSIILGNTSAKNIITIVTNPFCSHCAEIHEEMLRYDVLNTRDYCIQFIFDSYSSDKQIIDILLVSSFLSNQTEEWVKMLNDWFMNGTHNPGKFTDRYPMTKVNEQECVAECQKHWNWVDENKIIKTPLILINGYKLPINYTIKDLVFLDL